VSALATAPRCGNIVPISGRGRPSKLTPAVQASICAAVRAGNFLEVAAEAAGVSRATVFEWIARGEGRDAQRRRDRVYADFADAIRQANAEAEIRAVTAWTEQARHDWRATAAFLARRWPERWAPVSRVKIDGRFVVAGRRGHVAGERTFVEVVDGWDLRRLTDDEFKTLARLREKASRTP